jgi:hypothetical protein
MPPPRAVARHQSVIWYFSGVTKTPLPPSETPDPPAVMGRLVAIEVRRIDRLPPA